MSSTIAAEARALQILVDLLRFDTSNDGTAQARPERPAAEYCAELLAGAGLEPQLIESRPGRANVVARWPGADRTRPPLLVHGHLDVVPAEATDWSVPPFAGVVADDHVWGRGTVDMKNMIAMVLATIEQRRRHDRPPARDIVFALFADEENGCHLGSRWMMEHHRDLFADCDAAVSEVGGFSVTGPDGRRAYLLETARKGVAIMRATARSRPGHGSLVHTTSAIARLCEAVARLAAFSWPADPGDLGDRMFEGLSDLLGRELDPEDLDFSGTPLEVVQLLLASSIRHTANATVLRAGSSTNVVPAEAAAVIDGRYLPGRMDEFLRAVEALLGPEIRVDLIDQADDGTSPLDSPLLTAMSDALSAHDSSSLIIPYVNPASTDNVAFTPAGIPGYGFVPLHLPPGYDFAAMFHGIDERLPVESLSFGARVLDTFFDRI